MLGIFKYDLGDFSAQMAPVKDTELPKYLNITAGLHKVKEYLLVDVVNSHLWVWALVNIESEIKDVHFRVIPTGQPLGEDIERRLVAHIGSVVERDRKRVWHLFQLSA